MGNSFWGRLTGQQGRRGKRGRGGGAKCWSRQFGKQERGRRISSLSGTEGKWGRGRKCGRKKMREKSFAGSIQKGETYLLN